MPDVSNCNLYLDCDSDQVSAEQLFKILVKEDPNGCPAINVVTQGGGGGVPAGIATEITLQAVLTALNQHQDFEPKLIIDTGNSNEVACQIIEFDEQTTTYNYIYKDVNGNPYVPVGPIEYINPDANLSLILAELVALNTNDFATEATLASVETELTGGGLGLGTTEYTDASNHNTTAGKNTVMIICATGVEEINGIVHPAGAYTFQPNSHAGNDTVNAITVNAQNGKIIIHEL
jgi:hypothetical protein